MTPFLPQDYKIPTSSNYLKLTEGEHTFRVLSSAIVGYEYFTADNKPVRSQEDFEDTPNIKLGGRVSPFWAFVVYNYGEKRIQILEITQKTIMFPIKALVNNNKWGDPHNFDITITRKGTGKQDTEYSVMPNPHTPLDPVIQQAYLAKPVNLNALFTGADPFMTSNPTVGVKTPVMADSSPTEGDLDELFGQDEPKAPKGQLAEDIAKLKGMGKPPVDSTAGYTKL